MTPLEMVLDTLEKNKHITNMDYKIPALWNYIKCDFEKTDRSGEIKVNSNAYFTGCIQNLLSVKPQKNEEQLIVYSMLVRAFCAWVHQDELEGGTLLKATCLLPALKSMGFNAVCLLPIFELSQKYKKGEISSPYAIRDIMKIDRNLDDIHVKGLDLGIQFGAFCQAAHLLGMKVILDFAFRTAARDSVLIERRPEWFYWINKHCLPDFAAPGCDSLPHTNVNEKNVKTLYNTPQMKQFAKCFAYAPDIKTKESIQKKKNQAFEEAVQEKLGICIMPGFADTINDPQPPWSDVTFLKYYFDNTSQAKSKFGDHHAPMIAQDGVKCSVFEGEEPNQELWAYTKGVIPYYMEQYGIDGARIDMAHAMPKELNKQILSEIKKKNKNFILISEDFETAESGQAKAEGYCAFTGGIWDLWSEEEYGSMAFNKRLYTCISGELPCLSCVETADTPRCTYILGQQKCIVSVFITALMPNTVFFVNNGLEFGERQPMNLGLKNNEKGKYVLPRNHPLYGKLAFFDQVYFDWTKNKHIYKALIQAIKIRKKYSDVFKRKENFDLRQLKTASNLTIISGFNGKKGFLAMMNRGTEEIKVYAKKLIPKDAVLGECIYGCENKDVLYPNSVLIYDISPKKQN